MDLFASLPGWAEWIGAAILAAVLILLILRFTRDDDKDLPAPDPRDRPPDRALPPPPPPVRIPSEPSAGDEFRDALQMLRADMAERARRDEAMLGHQLALQEQLVDELRSLRAELIRERLAARRDMLPTASASPPRSLPDPPPPKANEYRIWFGTNRKPVDPADASKGFSADRDRVTRHGYCDVFVPKSHKIGSIGSSALRRLLTWTDDRLKLSRIAELELEAFWAAVASQLAEAAPGKRHAVVFIHGFNVSFEEAAIRAAQIGFDLGIGTMAFFSWPSKGSKTRRAYQSDGQTIGASEGAIADFLVDFAQRSGAEAVHLIVHSMGNQGVLRAMNEIVADAERRGGCRFGQLILAAADVDADTFERLAGAYGQLAERTTLYVSERDLALGVSAWFAEYPRVGLYPPVSVFDGIDTVSVSNIDLTLLGHGYVGEARDVLQDMHSLIFTGAPPPRFGLRPRSNAEGKAYWEVGE